MKQINEKVKAIQDNFGVIADAKATDPDAESTVISLLKGILKVLQDILAKPQMAVSSNQVEGDGFMTLTDVIAAVEAIKDNNYGDSAIIGWCSDIDQAVAQKMMKKYKAFTVSRVKDQASYALPADVDFTDIDTLYVDKEPVQKIDLRSYEKSGYYLDMDDETKFCIYPVPTQSDTTAGIRGIYLWKPARYTAAYTDALLVPDKFERIYSEFCLAKLYMLGEEAIWYRNYMSLYNGTWDELAKWCKGINPLTESRASNCI